MMLWVLMLASVSEWINGKSIIFVAFILLWSATSQNIFYIKPIFYVAAGWFGLSSSRKTPAALQIGVSYSLYSETTDSADSAISLFFFSFFLPKQQS